jgi:anti-sigma B factor antagonist
MDTGDDALILRVERSGQGSIVHIKGEVDMATVPQLRASLEKLAGSVVIDLTDVTFLDSSGLGLFVFARKRLASAGGALTLRNPNDVITRTLEAVALTDWIEE